MLELRLLYEHVDLEAICGLFAEVWHLDPANAPINAEILRALVHNDNYVCGAYRDGDVVGGSVGFWGRDSRGWLLHSHITGVRQDSVSNGVGFALKQHQRDWVLAHDVERITWTFDPLVRRNAYFNLTRLGAVAEQYHESFYGEMNDAINRGDESDRCVAVWNLARGVSASTVEPRKGGDSPAARITILESDPEGWPIEFALGIAAAAQADGAALLRAYIPSDIEALRRIETSKAMAWRRALRATFGAALRDGFTAETMTRDGWYTLRRAP